MIIDILGTKYKVKFQSEKENKKLKGCNGLCEYYSKELIVENMKHLENDISAFNNIMDYQNKVLRHEVIHAFLAESGLRGNSTWAENEEMVDWLAIQFPKIQKVFEKLNCI